MGGQERGGFFRLMMGADDLDEETPLFRDMHICTEFLNCTHEEFLNKPRIERHKLRMYLHVKALKNQKEIDEMKSKVHGQDLINKAPSVM